MKQSNQVLAVWLLVVVVVIANVGVDGLRFKKSSNLKDVKCARRKSSFDSYLFVDLKITEEPLDSNQLHLLGSTFQSTYNENMANNYCDLEFKEVVGTQAVFHEQLDESTSRYLLTVDGKCRGCDPINTHLFSFEDTRRQLHQLSQQQQEEVLVEESRELGRFPNWNPFSNGGRCTCPTDDSIESGSPSSDDFALLLQQIIHESPDLLPSVVSLVSLKEMEPIPCGEETYFETILEVMVESDNVSMAESMPESDVAELERGFKAVYNEMQGSCGSDFGSIDSVEILSIIGSDHQELVDASLLFGARRTQKGKGAWWRYSFIYGGMNSWSCRYCTTEATDARSRARRRELVQGGGDNRQEKTDGICFCAAAKTKGPDAAVVSGSKQDFLSRYALWLAEEQNAGKLIDTVQPVDIVEESSGRRLWIAS